MKTLKIIMLSCIFPVVSFAQDTIYVSHNKITTIQFPSQIISPVGVGKAINVEIEQGNILVLKAATKEFKFASLDVKTVDGQSYNLPLAFSYGRSGLTTRIKQQEIQVPTKILDYKSPVQVSMRFANEGRFSSISGDKNGKVNSQLGDIAISGNTFYYKLRIKNRSNINYDIDFIHFYVRDLKTAKRTVTQEQELYPINFYGDEHKTVAGQHAQQYVFALKKFPLSKDKSLFIEIYEKNGGRHLYLKVKQSDIENARTIK